MADGSTNPDIFKVCPRLSKLTALRDEGDLEETKALLRQVIKRRAQKGTPLKSVLVCGRRSGEVEPCKGSAQKQPC